MSEIVKEFVDCWHGDWGDKLMAGLMVLTVTLILIGVIAIGALCYDRMVNGPCRGTVIGQRHVNTEIITTLMLVGKIMVPITNTIPAHWDVQIRRDNASECSYSSDNQVAQP